jgi:DNA-binding CsgD family transcriptional regulator
MLEEIEDSSAIDHKLEAALESIGSAAFLLDANGSVRHANAVGRTLLVADREGVSEELRAALQSAETYEAGGGARRESTSARYWVSRLANSTEGLRGPPRMKSRTPQYVALLRAMPGDPGPRLGIIAAAWGLTARQTTVLGLVAQGMANKTISAYLNCAEVTVELHMTALLSRAGSSSRAELVARFWTFSLA